jgi:hypothetical protein
MPLACAGCRRGRVFLAGPVSGSLALCLTLLCPYPARKRFPPCKTRASSILANAKAAPYPERASNGFVIGASMPANEWKLVRIAKAVQSTGGVTDRLGARRDDPRILEKGVEPLTSGFQINEQFRGTSRAPPRGRLLLRFQDVGLIRSAIRFA